MIENSTIMRCGHCGNTEHKLYMDEEKDIITECVTCGNPSIITVSKPKLEVRWGPNSKGVITKWK